MASKFKEFPLEIKEYILQLYWKTIYKETLNLINSMKYETANGSTYLHSSYTRRELNFAVCQYYYYSTINTSSVESNYIKHNEGCGKIVIHCWSRLKPKMKVFYIKDIEHNRMGWGTT